MITLQTLVCCTVVVVSLVSRVRPPLFHRVPIPNLNLNPAPFFPARHPPARRPPSTVPPNPTFSHIIPLSINRIRRSAGRDKSRSGHSKVEFTQVHSRCTGSKTRPNLSKVESTRPNSTKDGFFQFAPAVSCHLTSIRLCKIPNFPSGKNHSSSRPRST
jgi:hypothetical protein